MAQFSRSSGILMPIFSLPSDYPIGSLGKEAYQFVDFLVSARQKYWQILPIGHTGYGNSPYQCYSVIAGNPYLISLEMLVEDGLLRKEDILSFTGDYPKVNYEFLIFSQMSILKKAFRNADSTTLEEVKKFEQENKEWINDYAFFMALKDCFSGKAVWEWNKDIRTRNHKAMSEYEKILHNDILFYKFIQYLFFRQYKKLKDYANSKGVKIIGDIPIYPSPDSCDVWANPKLFKVDEEKLVTKKIAGVPPDYYSATGQVWGNPVYDWNVHEKQGYSWWIWRMKKMFEISDVVRIDHFRAFCDYFEIPQGEETAVNGKWQPGPKMKLFNAIKNHLGDVPIIAEDLGDIDDAVREFLAESRYPGMRVMVFGLQENEDNMHLPHNWPKNCVGYTSTHDSETFVQKVFLLNKVDRDFAKDYVNFNGSYRLGLSAVRSAMASPANMVIFPIQDCLSLGREGRMNTPSTVSGGNWSWRLPKDALSEKLTRQLSNFTRVYKRC